MKCLEDNEMITRGSLMLAGVLIVFLSAVFLIWSVEQIVGIIVMALTVSSIYKIGKRFGG